MEDQRQKNNGKGLIHILWEEQKEIIHKVHKQVGHHTKKRMRATLMSSSIRWDCKRMGQELDWWEENCKGFILKKRMPCKLAALIPPGGNVQ